MSNVHIEREKQEYVRLKAMAASAPPPSAKVKPATSRGHYDAQVHEGQRVSRRAAEGFPAEGQPAPSFLDNKHYQGFANNIAIPMVEQAVGDGALRIVGESFFALKSYAAYKSIFRLGEASNEEAMMVYNGVKNGHLPSDYGNGLNLGRTRLTDAQMLEMTDVHGVEFAQTYTAGAGKNGGGGFYNLYSGTRSAVDVPVGSDVYLINHTHPGGTAAPSVFDIDYLKLANGAGSSQKSSIILPAGKKPVRFNVNTPANGAE